MNNAAKKFAAKNKGANITDYNINVKQVNDSDTEEILDLVHF